MNIPRFIIIEEAFLACMYFRQSKILYIRCSIYDLSIDRLVRSLI